MSLIPIYHPEHGVAVADESQLEAMKSEGWSKTKPKGKGPAGTTPEATDTTPPASDAAAA